VLKNIRSLLDRTSREQFLKYLIVGFVSFVSEYGFFAFLFLFLKLNELIANTIALGTIFWLNFLLNKFWSFKSKGNIARQAILYFILFVFNMSFSNVFIYLSSEVFNIYPLVSKIIAMALIVIWNFLLYKYIIYRD